MSEKMRLVECEDVQCFHIFEIPESYIKGMLGTNCILYEKAQCPRCGKKAKSLRDRELCEAARKQERIKANSPVSCPHCGSTQLYASDKGFSTGKALIGGALLGGVGLLAGMHGSKNVILTCLSCSHKWSISK